MQWTPRAWLARLAAAGAGNSTEGKSAVCSLSCACTVVLKTTDKRLCRVSKVQLLGEEDGPCLTSVCSAAQKGVGVSDSPGSVCALANKYVSQCLAAHKLGYAKTGGGNTSPCQPYPPSMFARPLSQLFTILYLNFCAQSSRTIGLLRHPSASHPCCPTPSAVDEDSLIAHVVVDREYTRGAVLAGNASPTLCSWQAQPAHELQRFIQWYCCFCGLENPQSARPSHVSHERPPSHCQVQSDAAVVRTTGL
jgi:hypothetical protein